MEKVSILIVGKYAEIECNLDRFRDHFNVLKLSDLSDINKIDEPELKKVQAIAFKGHSTLNSNTLKKLPSLRLISNFGVGYETINVADAKAANVLVTYTPDVLSDDVADLALALLFGVSRHLLQGDDWIRSGSWREKGEMPLNKKISGSTCGIIGLGRIGFEIAKRLESFKIKIHYYSRSRKNVSQKWIYHKSPVNLAKVVDNLFVSLVGGEGTRGFVSSEVLDALGPRGILVNISRGSTINETALLEALEKKKIYGAGLDVFENEPNINARFLSLKNVFIQPHQGSCTRETRKAMGELQFQNILECLAGRKALTPIPEMN